MSNCSYGLIEKDAPILERKSLEICCIPRYTELPASKENEIFSFFAGQI